MMRLSKKSERLDFVILNGTRLNGFIRAGEVVPMAIGRRIF